jgi:hypothetical protein
MVGGTETEGELDGREEEGISLFKMVGGTETEGELDGGKEEGISLFEMVGDTETEGELDGSSEGAAEVASTRGAPGGVFFGPGGERVVEPALTEGALEAVGALVPM